MYGFDYDLCQRIAEIVEVPLIFSGGASCYDDMVRIKSYLKGRKVPVREA